jgi:23S rRNA (guanosine2251-2'-O)-methyltransferase
VKRITVAAGLAREGSLKAILDLADRQGIPVRQAPRGKLDPPARGGGVSAIAGAYPLVDLEDVIDRCRTSARAPLVLLLDQVQDPQNLGSLLRTAEAVGASGVLLPLRRSAPVSPAVVNASAGAVEHLFVARANLAQAISRLQQEGLWVVGLDPHPDLPDLREIDLARPMAFVIGGEAEGMRRLVREACDWVVRLPTEGRVASLNAAVAGSIALYAAWGARQKSGGESGAAKGG